MDEETQEDLPVDPTDDPANDPTQLNSYEEEDCDTVSETKSTKKPIAKPDQGKPRTKRQKMEAEESQLIKKAIACMDKATGESKEDGFEFFGRYVASELRTIASSHAQRWAKLQIQNILYNVQNEPGISPRGSGISPSPHGSGISPSPHGSAYSMNYPYSPPPNIGGSESNYPRNSSISPSPSISDWSSRSFEP